MMEAICKGHLELVMYFIGKGIDVDGKDSYGLTPLIQALENNKENIVKFLLEKGANVEVEGEDGKKPIHYAVSYFSKENISLLIKYGADINSVNKYGITPLWIALLEMKTDYFNKINKDAISFLIEKGAKTDNTIMHHLADIPPYELYNEEKKENVLKVITLLINTGYDINAKDENGLTPLDYAEKKENQEIANHIRKSGGITGKKRKRTSPESEEKAKNLQNFDEDIIDFYCPYCGRKTSIKKSLQPLGKQKKCKGCERVFYLVEENMKFDKARTKPKEKL